MNDEKYKLTFFNGTNIIKKGYKTYSCESEEDMQEIIDLLNEKEKLINEQEGIIRKLEEHNKKLVKLSTETIHQISDEKNKLIYELLANSFTPKPIVLTADKSRIFLEDYE